MVYLTYITDIGNEISDLSVAILGTAISKLGMDFKLAGKSIYQLSVDG